MTAATNRRTVTGTRVLLAESRVLFRAGLRRLIDETADIGVISEVSSYADMMAQVSEHEPDVVVVGHLANDGGASAGPARRPETVRFLILEDSQEAEAPLSPEIFADGIFRTDTSPEDFCGAIRILTAGYTLRIGHKRQTDDVSAVSQHKQGPPAAITNRETEVLCLLACGQTNSEIAKSLSLTESTVKSHVQSLLRKLQLHNRAGAVIYAYEHGLIQAGASRRPLRPQRARHVSLVPPSGNVEIPA